MYVTKIPLENKDQFFEKSLKLIELIADIFPTLTLDIGTRYIGDATDISVKYFALMPDGSKRELSGMNMKQLLGYVKSLKPKTVLRWTHKCYDPGTVITGGGDWYNESEGFKFIGNGTEVSVFLSSKKLERIRRKPHHFVKISASDYFENTIRDRLQRSN